MKNRSPVLVILFGFITFGLYSWYWAVKTKGEMNKQGEHIPTAWIWLIPIIGSIWWYWKYSEGVENVTKKELSWVIAFLILYVLGPIGQGIVQDFLNKSPAGVAAAPISTEPAASTPASAPEVAPATSQPANADSGSTPSAAPSPESNSSPTPQSSEPANNPSAGANNDVTPPPAATV